MRLPLGSLEAILAKVQLPYGLRVTPVDGKELWDVIKSGEARVFPPEDYVCPVEYPSMVWVVLDSVCPYDGQTIRPSMSILLEECQDVAHLLSNIYMGSIKLINHEAMEHMKLDGQNILEPHTEKGQWDLHYLRDSQLQSSFGVSRIDQVIGSTSLAT